MNLVNNAFLKIIYILIFICSVAVLELFPLETFFVLIKLEKKLQVPVILMWEAYTPTTNQRHGRNSKFMSAISKCCKTNAEMSKLLLHFRVFALHHPLRIYLCEKKSCSKGQRSLMKVLAVKKHLNCDSHRLGWKHCFYSRYIYSPALNEPGWKLKD